MKMHREALDSRTKGTGKPKVNEKSLKMSENVPSLIDRSQDLHKKKQTKLLETKKEMEEKELKECSFRPKLTKKSETVESRHLEASKKYGKQQKESVASSSNLKFRRPKMNLRSKELSKDIPSLVTRTFDSPSKRTNHESLSVDRSKFAPTLNRRSERMAASKSQDSPAHDRLYNESKRRRAEEEELLRKRTESENRNKSANKKADRSPLPRVALPRVAQLAPKPRVPAVVADASVVEPKTLSTRVSLTLDEDSEFLLHL